MIDMETLAASDRRIEGLIKRGRWTKREYLKEARIQGAACDGDYELVDSVENVANPDWEDDDAPMDEPFNPYAHRQYVASI